MPFAIIFLSSVLIYLRFRVKPPLPSPPSLPHLNMLLIICKPPERPDEGARPATPEKGNAEEGEEEDDNTLRRRRGVERGRNWGRKAGKEEEEGQGKSGGAERGGAAAFAREEQQASVAAAARKTVSWFKVCRGQD